MSSAYQMVAPDWTQRTAKHCVASITAHSQEAEGGDSPINRMFGDAADQHAVEFECKVHSFKTGSQ
jgi:hypothetical protein